jgi:hypothetical protein
MPDEHEEFHCGLQNGIGWSILVFHPASNGAREIDGYPLSLFETFPLLP